MDLQELVTRIERMEDHFTSINNSLNTLNAKISEVDERAAGFLDIVREEKNELAKLNSKVMNIGQYDVSINQIRVDFNRRLDEIQKLNEKDQLLRRKLVEDEFKSVRTQIAADKKDIAEKFEKRLMETKDENNRIFTRIKELDLEIRDKVKAIDEYKNSFNSVNQDLRRIQKQLDGLQNITESVSTVQNNLRAKIDANTDAAKTNDARLNEIIATESERKQAQLDFIETQSLRENDRARIWKDWEGQFEELSKEVYTILPEVKNQQFNLKNAQSDFEEVTEKFERRINEITEIYRLTDEKFRKEWETYKSDSEKRWANISLVLEDRQGGLGEELKEVKDRMVLVEDNTHEMQEVLLLMSTEIQKGMQNIMKMVNGWMEAFGQIRTNN